MPKTITPSPLIVLTSLGTDEFARLNLVREQTVRARVCRTGTYFGIAPQKLASGRLAWPNVQVAK